MKGKKRALKVVVVSKKRKRNRNKASVVTVRGEAGQVMADRYFTKLRFVYINTMTGTSPYFQIGQNSLSDTMATVGIQQPMGLDQLAALYRNYRVHKSAVQFTAINEGTQPAIAIIQPVSAISVTPSVSLEANLEQRYRRKKILTSINAGGTTNLKHALSIKKFMGVKSITDSPAYSGQTPNPLAVSGTNPADPNAPFWNFELWSADGITSLNVAVHITVDYWVEFFGPILLPPS